MQKNKVRRLFEGWFSDFMICICSLVMSLSFEYPFSNLKTTILVCYTYLGSFFASTTFQSSSYFFPNLNYFQL